MHHIELKVCTDVAKRIWNLYWLEFQSDVFKTVILNGMPSTINVDRPSKGQFFLIMSSIFQQILITFDIEVDGHLLYHWH